MGKTRELFKKLRDTKATFHAKMHRIKDKNSMALTEAEDIKKKRQDIQKNYTRKIFMTQITTIAWSLTKNQTSRNVKSSGPWETSLWTKLVQFISVAQLCPALCNPMKRSTPGLPVHHHLPEFTQTHVHRVSDAIQPSHPLSSSFLPAPNPSQHKSLFQWVSSSHQVAKVLEFQLQHQSFQWIFRTDFL